MTVLSPSAERLTVVSRVVPKTVQLAKWQMFAGEEEEESQQPTRESTPTPQVPRGKWPIRHMWVLVNFLSSPLLTSNPPKQ